MGQDSDNDPARTPDRMSPTRVPSKIEWMPMTWMELGQRQPSRLANPYASDSRGTLCRTLELRIVGVSAFRSPIPIQRSLCVPVKKQDFNRVA